MATAFTRGASHNLLKIEWVIFNIFGVGIGMPIALVNHDFDSGRDPNMRFRCAMLCFSGIILLSIQGQADIIPPDPTITVGTPPGGSTPVFSTSFDVPLTPCPTGINAQACFDGVNESPADWTNLDLELTFTTNVGETLTCDTTGTNLGTIFTTQGGNCGEGLPSNLFTVVSFTGGTIPTLPTFLLAALGPDPTSEFVIAVNGWTSIPTVHADANVPEPSTVTLVLLGIGSLLSRRRLLARTRSRAT
jgi:PEP-CTERM motif-containing protein